MRYPTSRFLYLLLLPLAASLLLPPIAYYSEAEIVQSSREFLIPSIVAVDLLLLLLFLIDSFTIPRRKRFEARRTTDRVYSVGFAHRVNLDILVRPGLINRIRTLAYDDATEVMEVIRFPNRLLLLTGKNSIQYRLRINKRGNYRLAQTFITCYSILGLARRVYRLPCESQIRVYPDLKAVSRYALLARKSHLGLLGIRRARRAGGDNDFERLRDYQPDDEFRHIDWKATARQNNLIVRTYQMNQNQTIIFLLDCGRMMTAEFEGRSNLDYALNSVLLLAHVALRQGDRVGLLAFSSGVRRYVKPGSGANYHRRLVQAAYDLKAEHGESNFDLAFQYLNTVSRKRSLVCLITNVIDEMNSEMIRAYLGSLAGRHLPFAVLMKQREIHALLEEEAQNRERLFQQAAAADFVLWRDNVIQTLGNHGVLTLEAVPDQLDAALINEYLKIKARKLL